MNDSLTTFCSQCGRPVRVPEDAADDESLACPWCQATAPAGELRQATPPLMLKASATPTSESHEATNGVKDDVQVVAQADQPKTAPAAPVVQTGRQRDAKRGKKPKSPAWELAKIVLGGVAGSVIGYAILIYFVGQRADFLKLGPKLPPSIAPRWVDPGGVRAEAKQTPNPQQPAPPPEVELDRALAAVQAAWEATRLAGVSGGTTSSQPSEQVLAAYRRLEAPLSQMEAERIAERATELAYWLQRAAASTPMMQNLAADSFDVLQDGQVFVAVGDVGQDASGQTIFRLRGGDPAAAPSSQAPIQLTGREVFDEPILALLRASRANDSGSRESSRLQVLAFTPLSSIEAPETPVANSRSK